jgi:GAF domain-containing protein
MIRKDNGASYLEEWRALRTGVWLTDLANGAAFIFENLPELNWAGFYLNDGTKLVLGPFQGKVACTEIPFSKGVCGSAFSRNEAVIVDDVHAFPGHIVCDPASRSELVVPFGKGGEVWGVLDLDSARPARFTEFERDFGIEICRLLIEGWAGRPWGESLSER